MTIRNFDALLAPKSVALIGASTKPGRVGLITARNLLSGGVCWTCVVRQPEILADREAPLLRLDRRATGAA